MTWSLTYFDQFIFNIITIGSDSKSWAYFGHFLMLDDFATSKNVMQNLIER